MLPGVARVNISGIEDIDWRSVGWRGNVSPVPVVYMGTPGMTRKAVIHLVNPASGTCEAIVKVPLTEAAGAAILREADVLTTLADEDYTCAPRLLFVDEERGVATQTALNGKPGGRRFTAAYWELLRSLMLPGESTTMAGHAAEWQEQLLWAVGCEADISVMTAALSELCDPRPLPACWVHGDFTPWNMRHLPDGTVALLDWEEAQRGGLPLQDAFHFFHMQDFLFGSRPAVHSTDIGRFAKTIGISTEQCRKLEIAYLAHAYLQRRTAGAPEHCEYLLETLQIVLKHSHKRPAPVIENPAQRSREWARVVPFPQPSSIRSELFAAVIAQLNLAEIPYCVLGGHENHAENSSSDVDFMFYPRDMRRIAPLLAQAAQSAGARLVQAMPHETSACYFVMAKDDGSEIGYFDPDSAGDYRRQGRLWLSAEKVLAGRRRCKELYVPAVPDAFTYYLIKKVLKQSVADFQLRRLCHLYQRDCANCRNEISKFWSVATVRDMERALVASDLAWFQTAMPRLLAELTASAAAENLAARVVQRLRDGWRMLGRALHPTGMSVLVCGGNGKQQSEIAEGILRQLAPAFRRVTDLEFQPAGASSLVTGLRLAKKALAARLRSTLVVIHVADGSMLNPRMSRFAAELLFRPDLIFVLTDGEAQMLSVAKRGTDFGGAARRDRVVYLNRGLSPERNMQQASRSILAWLAARQERRLRLKHGPVPESNRGPLAGKLGQPVAIRWPQ